MCGRYGLVPDQSFDERFRVENRQEPLFPQYNIAPGASMPVVVRNSPNRVAMMKWGLIPHWSKEPQVKFSTINARAETITTSPAYRAPFRSRRCLVPASGFYEWRATKDGKQPYFIRLKGEQLFAFAGLYDVWRDAEGQELFSYTIITTAPNSLMTPIHNRMPVILRREDEDAWLDKDTGTGRLVALLVPYPAERMEAYTVSRAVNNPAHEGEELIRPEEQMTR
jgi:putative SOS response-associated peptidase YedK